MNLNIHHTIFTTNVDTLLGADSLSNTLTKIEFLHVNSRADIVAISHGNKPLFLFYGAGDNVSKIYSKYLSDDKCY